MTTTGWAKLCLKVAEKTRVTSRTSSMWLSPLAGKRKGRKSEESTEENAAGVFVNRKDLMKTCKKIFGDPDGLMPLRTTDEEEHEV
eukprot:9675231-Lingulodinium_polyedra.AAC.1